MISSPGPESAHVQLPAPRTCRLERPAHAERSRPVRRRRQRRRRGQRPVVAPTAPEPRPASRSRRRPVVRSRRPASHPAAPGSARPRGAVRPAVAPAVAPVGTPVGPSGGLAASPVAPAAAGGPARVAVAPAAASPTSSQQASSSSYRDELQPQEQSFTAADAPVPEGTVVVERGVSAQEFGPKLNRTAADVVKFLLQHGEMVTVTMGLSDEHMELFALELGADLLLVDPGPAARGRTPGDVRRQRRRRRGRCSSRARRSSPSWVTSTTARRPCSTRSARPTSSTARPVASPSTSAPTRSSATVTRSPSSTPPATPRSRRCVPVAPRRPTSSCWSSPPTTA